MPARIAVHAGRMVKAPSNHRSAVVSLSQGIV